MAYNKEKIKEGITAHYITTEKFKTNLIAIALSVPLTRENVTYNALIPAVLKRGTENLKTQEAINIELENMYGAVLDCGIEKSGDNQILKFYIETLNEKFIPEKEELSKKSINLLLELIERPLLENGHFKIEYVESEKNHLKKIIEGKIDNKDKYSYERCIEEMYKEQNYGLYKYGYVEDLSEINAKNLYEKYQELLETAKIDVFVSGDCNVDLTSNTVIKGMLTLNNRKDKHILNDETTEIKKDVKIAEIKEEKDVAQGKLVIGLDIQNYEKDSKYAKILYNVILGESPTSKMFQNVREKASLAYSARSNYLRQKNNIYIRCGIEIKNYEKTVELITEQIDDMKNGKFTEEDLINAKHYVEFGMKSLQDEQDSEITYYLSQEMAGKLVTIDEYVEKIKTTTKEQIVKIANSIKINTIYFLTGTVSK